MKKNIRYGLLGLLAVAVVALTGGSFYMLGYSLTPKDNKGKDIPGSYEYMHSKYPFITPWLDSLQTTGALRDTFIINREGRQLHAMFASAAKPTDKTAVIVHGYTDNAIRMLMIGYLYNNDLNYNILLPDLQNNGLSEGPAIQMGWKDRLDVLNWMNIANDIFGKTHPNGSAWHLHGSRNHHDGIRRSATAFCEMLRRRLRLYECMGRVFIPTERYVRTARISVNVHHQLAMQCQVWLEFPRSFFLGTSEEMQPSHVLHPWRCGYVRTYPYGLPFV